MEGAVAGAFKAHLAVTLEVGVVADALAVQEADPTPVACGVGARHVGAIKVTKHRTAAACPAPRVANPSDRALPANLLLDPKIVVAVSVENRSVG